ncbi:MAG: DUF1003 domain-containing protein, partial [Chloroflexota bacterium]
MEAEGHHPAHLGHPAKHPSRLALQIPGTVGERASDAISNGMGSWRFIIIQSIIVVIWVILNVAGFVARWDPYPFILLNLLFSVQAAYAAPIIMMSQNRQSAKDRLMAIRDDEQIGLLVHLQTEQMASLQWQVEALRRLLLVAGYDV